MPVLLDNLAYEDNDGLYRELQVFFTPEKAFLTLANICVNNCSNRYFRWKLEELFQKRSSDAFLLRFLKEIMTITRFSESYLAYLRGELIRQAIHPYDLLQLSGTASLKQLVALPAVQSFILEALLQLQTFQALSNKDRVMFYTFLEAVKDAPLFQRIKKRSFTNELLVKPPLLEKEFALKLSQRVAHLLRKDLKGDESEIDDS